VTSDSFEPWDVVVVPFPYSERLAEKRRPALVVSNGKLHREGYVWLAMITGAGKRAQAGDVEIVDLTGASLPGPSMVRATKVTTVEPARIVRRIGALALAERAGVLAALESFLAR
jgi:mRNA interferase MazF